MATICRFRIPTTDEPFDVKIKGFQEVVHAGYDNNGDWCFWAVTNPVLHLLRPMQQWGVQPGASMEDDKPVTPSANITRHMIGDLRKHLRSAKILASALAPPLGGEGVLKIEDQLDDIELQIQRMMKDKGIPQDSVTLGYEDESH